MVVLSSALSNQVRGWIGHPTVPNEFSVDAGHELMFVAIALTETRPWTADHHRG